MSRRICLALLASLGVALAAPPRQSDRFVVKVRTTKGDVPVGEITRSGGKVTVKGLSAPSLDRIADRFVAEWKAHRWPAKVTITDNLASDTGMRPTWRDHSATFSPGDKLYVPAMIRAFVTSRGYEALGMASIDFIIFDRSPEFPPGAHDRASTFSNFRKNTELDFDQHGGHLSFYIHAPVRAGNRGTDGVRRRSASDPTLAVPTDWDDGKILIAIMKVSEDGRVEIEPIHQGTWFEKMLPAGEADVEMRLMVNGEWTSRTVAKTSPWNLEAKIIEDLERRHAYVISPTIDPAYVR